MRSDSLIILKGRDIAALLDGREAELLAIIERAYRTHAAAGESSLPHSVFLRFPRNPANRIIALPAWLGDGFQIAGVKWIASFPANIQTGMDRASGVLILSSAQTGAPEAVLEGSVVSAKRTAASAALAALHLYGSRPPSSVGLIGCGVINFEIARFLRTAYPELQRFCIADMNLDRASQFRAKLQAEFDRIEVSTCSDNRLILEQCRLISLATNAAAPHIHDLSPCHPETVILHVSLRDIAPHAILECDNYVDDVDHVCRAATSIHLAEQLQASRDFITGTLGQVLQRPQDRQNRAHRVTIFSPFGLGILDLAVGQFVLRIGRDEGRTIEIPSFLPQPWAETA